MKVFENNLTHLKVRENLIMLLVVWTATEEVPKPVYCIVKIWWCYEFGKYMEVMGSRGVDIKCMCG